MLLSIVWALDPRIFPTTSLSLRWYGVLFGLGLMIGYNILGRMFKSEGVNQKWTDKIFYYVLFGTIIGARLGHVFFYAWDYYSQHLIEILYTWQGGLASHGGALGVILGLYLYSKKVTKRHMFWALDRLMVPAALVCAFIRFGNLMNSEIYGVETSLPWGVIFANNGETVPKHPTQLYEAFSYLIIFVALIYIYKRTELRYREGFMFGFLISTVFLSRFFIEYIKNDQVAFEAGMALNMGQLLSIPFVLVGSYLMYRGLNRPPVIYKNR